MSRQDMHLALGLEYLIDRRGAHTSTMVYRGINNMSTPFINQLFQKTIDTNPNGEGRITRSQTSKNVVIPRSNKVYGDKRFQVRGGVNWNALSQATKYSPSLQTFKTEIAKQCPIAIANLPPVTR